MRVISSQRQQNDRRLFPARDLDMLDPILRFDELEAPDDVERPYRGFERVTYVLADGRRHGFELWVNLPKGRGREAARQQITAWDAPQDTTPDGRAQVRVIAGEVMGLTGPLTTQAPITLLDWTLGPDARVEHPLARGHHGLAYVFEGEVRAGGQLVKSGEAALIPAGSLVTLATRYDGCARVLVLAAAPLNQPIVRYGPFVMSSEDEVLQALRKRAA